MSLQSPLQGDEDDDKRFHGGSYRGLFSLLRHSKNDSAIGLFWMVLCATFHLRLLPDVINQSYKKKLSISMNKGAIHKLPTQTRF